MSSLFLNRFKKTLLAGVWLILILFFQNCGGGFEVSSEAQLSAGSGFVDPDDDKQPPAISILTPRKDSYVNLSGKLSGTCEAMLPLTYNFNDSAQGQIIPCNNNAFALDLPKSLVDGLNKVWISQTDKAGNKSLSEIQFTLDTKAPLTEIKAPINAQVLDTSASLDISGTCESSLTVGISGTALAAPLSAPCLNSQFKVSGVTRGSAGAGTIISIQTDLALNKRTHEVTLSLKASTVPVPLIAITDPAANSYTKNRSITVKGTCETGLQVQFSGTGISSSSQTSCTAGAFSAAIQLSTPDGLKNVVASQTNSGNKTGQATRSFQLDTTAPALAIVSPAAGYRAETSLMIGGNCESGITVNFSGAGIASAKSTTCSAGMYSVSLDFSAGLGVKLIKASQIDVAGNESIVERSFERIAPIVYDGYALYAAECSACHLALTSTTKAGRTAAQISGAIASISVMRSISLVSGEINAIAFALSNPKPSPSPTPPTSTPIPTLPLAGVRVPATSDNLNLISAFRDVPVRRLSRDEIQMSLLDVLKLAPTSTMLSYLPVDLSDERTNPFDNGSDSQSISSAVVESYNLFAKSYAESFVGNTANIRTLAGCTPSAANDTACFRRFASAVGRLLLRRTITAAELTRYEKLTAYSVADNNFYVGPKLLVQALAQHPEFLYRIEVGSTVSGNTVKILNNFEIASRLSYLLWGSAPDDALLTAAESGQLTNSSQRLSQLTRMLASSKARRQWQRYHAQWLGYEDVPLNSNVAADMRNESAALVDHIAFNSTEQWLRLFNYEQTYVSAALARHYGLGSPASAAWQARAGGIFTHGTVLALGSKFGDTSPTLRGYKILKRVLCQPLGPVPPGIDPDNPPGSATQCKTDRYSMRLQTSCQSCHALMDNIGFGLENYDSNGLFRTTDKGLSSCKITGEGALGDKRFTGVEELSDNLMSSPAAIQCASRQLLRFTLGRPTSAADLNTVEAMHAQYLKTPQFTSMLQAIVGTQAFIHK